MEKIHIPEETDKSKKHFVFFYIVAGGIIILGGGEAGGSPSVEQYQSVLIYYNIYCSLVFPHLNYGEFLNLVL